MKTQDHIILNEKCKTLNCPKNSVPLTDLKYIVMHYTASTTLSSAVRYLSNPKNEVSAHLIIDKNGDIVQLVPFNIQAWHAGKSQYNNDIHINKYSIGIELVNAGKLTLIGKNYYTTLGTQIPQEQVVIHKSEDNILSYWHSYPEEQISSLMQVCKLLKQDYPQIEEIIGHSDITNRKIDPGKAFPWEQIKPILELI